MQKKAAELGRVIMCVSLAAAVTGCSIFSPKAADSTQPAVPEITTEVVKEAGSAAAAVRNSDQIAAGYLIKLEALEDANLNGEFRVDFDGRLKLPYDVAIDAEGLTLSKLTQAVRSAYKPYFRGAPSLSVSIAEKRCYVDVEGLVLKPGQYLVKHDSTLDELIAQAGGLQQGPGGGSFAARYAHIEQNKGMTLVRLSEYYAGARELVPAWEGGDRVFFQSEGKDAASATAAGRYYVQVLGQVSKPGEYAWEDGADFFFYLSKAGGPTQSADLDKIEIIRLQSEKKESIVFKMKDVRGIPNLRGGDIVVLHAEKPRNFIYNITSIIGSLSTSVLAAAAL